MPPLHKARTRLKELNKDPEYKAKFRIKVSQAMIRHHNMEFMLKHDLNSDELALYRYLTRSKRMSRQQALDNIKSTRTKEQWTSSQAFLDGVTSS